MKLLSAFLVFGFDDAMREEMLQAEFESDYLTLSHQPKLLEAYPLATSSEDRYQRLHVFALPKGVSVFRREQPTEIYHFVSTDVAGVKTYCTCFRLCERLTKRKELFTLRSLVMTASKPLYTLHRQFLEHFRELVCRGPQFRMYQEGMKYRVDYRELLLSALLNGLPTHDVNEVLVTHYPSKTIDDRELPCEPFLRYRRAIPFSLPNFPFQPLLHRLRPENIIDVLHCLLLELRVVLVCREKENLAPVAEALIELLRPFQWRHVFVPYLPEQLYAYLDAPVPFLMGLETKAPLDPGELVIVDLDHGEVSVPVELPSLPAPYATLLAKTLREIMYAGDQEKSPDYWILATLQTQRAMLMYFIQILGRYEEFFVRKDIDPRQGGYNSKAFLESVDQYEREFYEQMLKTQLWMQFLEGSLRGGKIERAFGEYRERLRSSSDSEFRLDMQREIERKLEGYRTPLRVGLEELIKQYRPEPSSPTPAPITARPDNASYSHPISPPSDRLIVGNYWMPLNHDYFIDFSEAPGKVMQPTNDGEEQILVRDLNTGMYILMTLK